MRCAAYIAGSLMQRVARAPAGKARRVHFCTYGEGLGDANAAIDTPGPRGVPQLPGVGEDVLRGGVLAAVPNAPGLGQPSRCRSTHRPDDAQIRELEGILDLRLTRIQRWRLNQCGAAGHGGSQVAGAGLPFTDVIQKRPTPKSDGRTKQYPSWRIPAACLALGQW